MLPFSRAQFLAVFVEYNLGVWPAQLIASGLGLSLVLLRPAPNAARAIGAGLAVMWTWTGLAYHSALFFGDQPGGAGLCHAVRPAGPCCLCGGPRRATLRPGGGSRVCGLGPAAVCGVLYPLAGMWFGHRYPELPMFGITPCPLTLFTFGLLMLTAGPVPRRLLVIPLIWSLIGGSAALLLGIPQDWVLLASGIVTISLLMLRDRTPRQAAAAAYARARAVGGRRRYHRWPRPCFA